MGLKLGQLNEREVQTVYHLIAVQVVYYVEVVYELIGVVIHEHLVDKIERVHWLQQLVLALLVELPHECLGGVEQHALLECLRPQHLHLHDELPSFLIAAPHVHYAVLAHIVVRHKLWRQILHALYLLIILQWQQCVEQTYEQVFMLAEYLFESKVGFGSRYLIMEKYLRVDDCDYILYVANLLIIIEIYDKKY